MSWLNDLFMTYENSKDQVGVLQERNGRTFSLLPVSHKEVNAYVEVLIDPAGNFYRGQVLTKDKFPTLVPTTTKSSNRSSVLAPHLLHDYLKYVAGDYFDYTQEKPKKETGYQLYLKQLEAWAADESAPEKVKVIYGYLKKGTLIEDLVKANVLYVKDGKLLTKWDSKNQSSQEKPEIFKVVPNGDETKTFVRFSVYNPQKELNIPTWEDSEVISGAISYSQKVDRQTGLDYVTGEVESLTSFHPSGIRFGGDMAKLISANDEQNFTFLGRFQKKEEVVGIGDEVSQKAHNALKWLIAKQGLVIDGRVYLVWNNQNITTPAPEKNAFELMIAEDEEIKESSDVTQKEFAKKFNKALQGYQVALEELTGRAIHSLILDAATPGRMGVLYYNSFTADEYLNRIKTWHGHCDWRHTYYKDHQFIVYYGAPSLYKMAIACYGERANKKIINQTIQTLYLCLVEGKKIPKTLSQKAVEYVSNPKHFDEKWQWLDNISTACSIIKNAQGVILSMAINQNENERSYLFGRLLAVAHALEEKALGKMEVKRETNAMRYMPAFSLRPVKTWKIIRESLLPYQRKIMGEGNVYYNKLMQEITEKLDFEKELDKPLNGYYILGFDSQLYEIYNKKNTIQPIEEEK